MEKATPPITCEAAPPRIESCEDGEMPGSVRVAIASGKGDTLSGHFGSWSIRGRRANSAWSISATPWTPNSPKTATCGVPG